MLKRGTISGCSFRVVPFNFCVGNVFSKADKEFSFFSRVWNAADRTTDCPFAENWIEIQTTAELNGKPVLLNAISEQFAVVVV